MAGRKILFLGSVVLLTLCTATAFKVDIDVSEVTSHGAYDFNYREDPGNFQQINTTVENLGSIGCSYRLKGEFEGKGLDQTRYSGISRLWPGDSELLTLYHLPLNYTGEITAEVSVEYCDQEKLLEEFNYTWEQRRLSNQSLEASALEADEDSARVSIESVENGIIVPEEKPPGWKVSGASLEDGRAEIEYEAPIFEPERNLTYKVVNDQGELVGTTKFNLETPEGIIEKLRSNIWKLLFFSLLVFNILMVAAGKLKL